MDHRITLPALLSLTIALAGCQVQLPGGGEVDLGPALDNAAAKDLLIKAAKHEEPRRAIEMRMVKDGVEILQMRMAMDGATGRSLMFMKGDPGVLGEGGDGEGSSGAHLYKVGITTYTTRAGTAMQVNKTAHAVANGTSGGGMPGGSDDFSKDMFDDFRNATVKGVSLVAHNGAAAARVEITVNDSDGPQNLTVLVQRDPARVLKVEGVHPGKGNDDPARGAKMTLDFTYGSEVAFNPPEALERAIGLAHKSQDTYGGTGPKKVITFQTDSAIPLAEIEAHVKQPPQGSGDHGHGDGGDGGHNDGADGGWDGGYGDGSGSGGSAPEPDTLTTLWSMKLSEGTKAQGGVTLKFTDADGDGKVSKDDRLEITWTTQGQPPMVFVFDTKTGTYVVPPAALLLALLGLAGAALALRRRA